MATKILELSALITNRINHKFEQKRKLAPAQHNRASEIGHPCARYLWYKRADNPGEYWKDYLKMPDIKLMMLFEEGKWHENRIIADMMEMGFNIIHFQKDWYWKEFNIKGLTDYRMEYEGIKPTCEVKATAYDIPDDLSELKGKLWYDKWRVQALIYPWMANEEEGMLVHKNRSNGQIKILTFNIHDKENTELVELSLQRCKIVEEHLRQANIHAEELRSKGVDSFEIKQTIHKYAPERCPFDVDVCPNCEFYSLCNPTSVLVDMGEHIDSELPLEIKEYLSLEESAKRYDKLKKRIKAKVDGIDSARCGNYIINGKQINVNGYSKDVESFSYWRWNIKEL